MIATKIADRRVRDHAALLFRRIGARLPSFAELGNPSTRLQPAAFVAASGSAGTLAAGDYLKEKHGTRIVAVEASECPTLLRNGFGARVSATSMCR